MRWPTAAGESSVETLQASNGGACSHIAGRQGGRRNWAITGQALGRGAGIGSEQAIKKPACGRLLGGGQGLFLVSRDCLVDQAAGLFGAPPVGYNLKIDPLPPSQAQVRYVQRFHVLSEAAGYERTPAAHDTE